MKQRFTFRELLNNCDDQVLIKNLLCKIVTEQQQQAIIDSFNERARLVTLSRIKELGLVERAKEFATLKHAEIQQVRKYTGEPYINHPAEVVEIVKSVKHTDEMLAAAWLHDVVEDTNTTIEEIMMVFGPVVTVLVDSLTDISKPEDGNRATRKAMDRKHISTASANAKTVKLADLISNSSSIIERDPSFAKIYLAEKRLLLEVLKEGDKTLWDRANKIAN